MLRSASRLCGSGRSRVVSLAMNSSLYFRLMTFPGASADFDRPPTPSRTIFSALMIARCILTSATQASTVRALWIVFGMWKSAAAALRRFLRSPQSGARGFCFGLLFLLYGKLDGG